jgi:uncharacterized protein
VKAGDIVKVKVLEVDAARKRIALTMRLSDEAVRKPPSGEARPAGRGANSNQERNQERNQGRGPRSPDNRQEAPAANNALAAAFAKATKR